MASDLEEILKELSNLTSVIDIAEPIVPDLSERFLTPARKINKDFENYKNLIRISHLNAVSVPKHRDEIFKIVSETQMDIICVSETNIKKTTPPETYAMCGYNLFRYDRNYTTKGGVGIYVKDTLKAKKIHVTYNKPQPELCFIEVEVRNNKLLVGVIYKPPKEDYTLFGDIAEILAFFTTKYQHVILCGDLNIDQLKSETIEYKYLLKTIIEPLSLTQLVKEPTRITKKTSTLLDLILVNSPKNVKCSGVVDIPGISDHSMVYAAYAMKKPKWKPIIIKRRDFRKFSEVEFRRDMENASWGNIYALEESDVNNQTTVVENIFIDIINKHAPYREIKVKKPVTPAYMTDEIVRMMDKRDMYKNKFNQYKSTSLHDTFIELKNKVNYMIRKAKKKDFEEKINSKIKNSKKFHRALKDNCIVTSKIRGQEECNIDPDILNKNFVLHNNAEVNSILLDEQIRKINLHTTTQCFEFKEVSELEVKKVARSLKSNATGIDDISAFFIKESIEYSVHAITEIINASLKFNIFPTRWKRALIKPIPKCSEPKESSDYRPISLLAALSKILEKIVAKQMKEHLEENELLDEHQSAYKAHHSTTTALIDILDNINEAFDKAEITVLTLLDYSKAFDCANHKLILAKLKKLGFKNSALEWINSYLTDRSQQVVTSRGISKWAVIKNGVPQGSVLGPLLFTVLIHDLKEAIRHCAHHLYADDTQLYISGKVKDINKLVLSMNEDLEATAKFSDNNFLKLNSKKSMYIILGSARNINKLSKEEVPPIRIGKNFIERKTIVRNLGVIFDENLNFESHMNTLIRNAYYRLKQAYRFKNFLSMESKVKIAESYILANFNYCDILFLNISNQLKRKIQNFQNTCVRFIFGLKKYDHISEKFKSLNILNMENRRKLHSLTTMHKIINNLAPTYLSKRIRIISSVHSHNTRGNGNLISKRAKNNYGQNSFFNVTAREYNMAREELKFKKNISCCTLKMKLKLHLLKKQSNER